MLRNITLGQYYSADSPLHRLDPRVKIAGTLLYMVALFFTNSLVGWILAIGSLAAVTGLSRVPVGKMLRGVRAIWILILVMVVCNLLFTQTGDVLFARGILSITTVGIRDAVVYTLRLICLVMGASVMTLTTSPSALTDGLARALRPFARIGIPVGEIAMMMSIALRFIPILGEEAEKIKRAQLARGADFDDGGIFRRARGLIPLVVPLFVSAFRRAEDLAMAMDARCYRGGVGRTQLHPLTYARRDALGYAIALAYFVVMIVLWRIFL